MSNDSKQAFTPGWVSNPYTMFIREPDGKPIAAVYGESTECFADDIGMARARLISAAPEMYEALKGLVEAVRLDSDEGGKGISGYTGARLTDARAALLKATGASS